MRLGVLCSLFACVVLLMAQQSRDLRLEPDQPANPLGDRGARWALVVGVSNHQYLPPQAQLRFAHRDAEDFGAFLRSTAGGGLPASHVRVLTNEKATLAAIRASLHSWLVSSAGPEDIIYIFFAGHGVTAERDESFFIAHDSDPQNLHATALPFAEVDEALSDRLRAGLAVVAVDACHSGNLGWSTYSSEPPARTGETLARLGRDRSFLKLLASRPSERSYEDERWAGGHGIFTHSLLTGLRGSADRDADGVVRAGEVIDYLGRVVPEQTESRQHPRVAGTFDARIPLAMYGPPAPPPTAVSSLDLNAPAGSAIYVDNAFRGAVRPDGTLRVDGLALGIHRLSVDYSEGVSLDGRFTLASTASRMTIPKPASNPVTELRARIAAGQIMEPGGAWDFYRQQASAGPLRPASTAVMAEALEQAGQECVSDYVQSTAIGPKKALLRRAADAFERLGILRPNDKSVETRRMFCTARLQIADGQFQAAVSTLQQVIQRDPDFACAHNALGVALERLNRLPDSRRAFEAAARLTPEWALPFYQIAAQHIARGEYREAEPLLAKAVRFNPRSVSNRWNLMYVHRLMGRPRDVENDAVELLRVNPAYAPAYLELARSREAAGAFPQAAEAYDLYLQLAPNYADSEAIRSRSQQIRNRVRNAPTLRKQ